MPNDLEFHISEMQRLVMNLIRIGKVAATNYADATVKVQIGELETDWVPWLSLRAGQDRSWNPPTVGEQVLVLSPGGDLACAVVVGSLYQTAHPAPSSTGTETRTQYRDGAVIGHDAATHALTVQTPGAVSMRGATGVVVGSGGPVTLTGSAVAISADGGGNTAGTMSGTFHLTGAMTITGNLTVNGNITASGNIIDGGSNTNHHTH